MRIDRNEALRYMGYRGQAMDADMYNLLEECIKEVEDISKKSYTYGVYEIERLREGISLKETTLVLMGEAIEKHLKRSDRCAVMAATLGLEVDRRIAFYSKTELTKGLMFDACAAAAVEALCDEVQREIEVKAEAMGLKLTSRFSPGYGDFSIDIQRDIARVLKTYEKIGLTVNENSIMIPRKSVTAVIGMQQESCSTGGRGCSNCEADCCIYRKDSDCNG